MIKVKKNGMIVVRFLVNEHAYQAGKYAGFPPAKAADLVGKKIARYATMADVRGREDEFIVVTAAAAPAPAPEKAAQEPAPPSDEPDPLDEIRASDDWRSINGNKLRSIASKVTDSPITNKDDAIAAIELALESEQAA